MTACNLVGGYQYFGRARREDTTRKTKDNIKMDLKEIGWVGVD
jgi:hypothetical protein